MTRFPGTYSGLTVRQADLLSFLRHEDAEGRTPTLEQMAHGIGLAGKGGVHRLLQDLVDRGYVTKGPGTARSYRLARDPEALESYSLNAILSELNRRGYPVSIGEGA